MVARDTGRIDFKPIPGTELEMEVDLVLLAMGFLGPERNGMLSQLGVKLTDRGVVGQFETCEPIRDRSSDSSLHSE